MIAAAQVSEQPTRYDWQPPALKCSKITASYPRVRAVPLVGAGVDRIALDAVRLGLLAVDGAFGLGLLQLACLGTSLARGAECSRCGRILHRWCVDAAHRARRGCQERPFHSRSLPA